MVSQKENMSFCYAQFYAAIILYNESILSATTLQSQVLGYDLNKE